MSKRQFSISKCIMVGNRVLQHPDLQTPKLMFYGTARQYKTATEIKCQSQVYSDAPSVKQCPALLILDHATSFEVSHIEHTGAPLHKSELDTCLSNFLKYTMHVC